VKIRVSKEVQKALDTKSPIVALESTIISHGMPYPENIKTALKVEEEIRKNGAIPATIAVLDGECVIGLSSKEIKAFGQRKDLLKVSRRDLAYVVAKKLSGGTTVAATLFLAEKVGIKVFVTGGIGGVHRGAQTSFDISADLDELANSSLTLICAGAKAILDLPLTLEYLETKGVAVYGYKTTKLPAFYSSDSPYKVDYKLDSPEEIALVMASKEALKIKGGLLIANPLPDAYSCDYEEMERYIKKALVSLEKEGIYGKETTPYLLTKIAELSGGKSLESNIALIINNAQLGAKIACAYFKLQKEGDHDG
jgi:pseudouridine-5'-phosphate glycosidase